MRLKFYDCLLKIGGDPLLNQIPLQNVSERELRVLRHVHTEDCISAMVPTRQAEPEREVDEMEHYFELVAKFDNNRKLIETIFNKTLDGFDEWMDQKQYQQDEERMQRDLERQNIQPQGGQGAEQTPQVTQTVIE